MHTLWGELAWQLGGKETYGLIAGDDRAGTNPGEVLRNTASENCQWRHEYFETAPMEVLMIIKAIGSVPGLLNSWRESRTSLFGWLVCLASMLAIASMWSGSPPSRLVGAVIRLPNLASIESWVRIAELQAFLAQHTRIVQHVLLWLLVMELFVLLIGPIWNATENDDYVESWVSGLVGARGCGLVWIILFLVTELAPGDAGLRSWRPMIWEISLFSLGLLMTMMLLHNKSCTNSVWKHPPKASEWMGWFLYCVLLAGTFILFGLIQAAFSPIAEVAAWLATSQSDAHRKATSATQQKMVEIREPTDAIRSAVGRQSPNTQPIPDHRDAASWQTTKTCLSE